MFFKPWFQFIISKFLGITGFFWRVGPCGGGGGRGGQASVIAFDHVSGDEFSVFRKFFPSRGLWCFHCRLDGFQIMLLALHAVTIKSVPFSLKNLINALLVVWKRGPSKSSLVKIHIGLILRSCCLRNGLKLLFFKRSFRSSNLAIASALPCFGDLVAAWFEPGYNLRIYFCLGFIFLLFSKSWRIYFSSYINWRNELMFWSNNKCMIRKKDSLLHAY